MLTFNEALAKAQNKIVELASEIPGHDQLVILHELVRERSRGWVFPFNTNRFVETRYPLDGLVGYGPIFVDRRTGDVYLLGAARIQAWLDTYDRTGAPLPNRSVSKKPAKSCVPGT